GMGAARYRHDADFARFLDEALLALPTADWHPLTAPSLDRLSTVQRATWAVQVATARTLTHRFGARPRTLIGHSLGEVAAAHLAGALDLHDAAHLVHARSELLERIAPTGGMIAARLDEHTAAQIAAAHRHGPARVEVAALNTPARVVLTAPTALLDELWEDLDARGADPRRLHGAPPAHSALVEPVLDELASALRGLRRRPLHPDTTLVSTVTGHPVTEEDLGADYWVAQLRAPVRFADALAITCRHGRHVVQELSPRPVLTVPTVEIRAFHGLAVDAFALADRDPAWAAAHAHVHGADVTWPHTPAAPVSLPPPDQWADPAQDTGTPTRWADRITATAGFDAAVRDAVRAVVADLAPVQIGTGHDDTPLERLGLHSMDVLQLRGRLLTGLAAPPRDLPDHRPTIASIAAALAVLITAEQRRTPRTGSPERSRAG
ncbi:acyltransferase domain-containing protein, partial [Nocardiopsis sp. NRRL B-16309]|uniref:acyltransferase domain-containing protein n=1 Tax=Nocardiopsis sp. NRRL B-16309 TaxID=1519494 RepID=UPI000AE6EFA5